MSYRKVDLLSQLRCFHIPLFDWVWMINQENVNFLYMTAHFIDFVLQTVGNKAKGRISKRVSQENKERQIFRKTQWIIWISLLTQGSLGLQYDCQLLKRWFYIIKSKVLLNMSFSKAVEDIDNSNTGHWLSTYLLLFFLWTGTMFFKVSHHKASAKFQNLLKYGTIMNVQLRFSILIEILYLHIMTFICI